MEITINGKKYSINSNIKFGLFKKLSSGKIEPEEFGVVLKAVLDPKPTNKAIDNMDLEQIFEVIILFQKSQEAFLRDIKKKLSI